MFFSILLDFLSPLAKHGFTPIDLPSSGLNHCEGLKRLLDKKSSASKSPSIEDLQPKFIQKNLLKSLTNQLKIAAHSSFLQKVTIIFPAYLPIKHKTIFYKYHYFNLSLSLIFA
ncbi:hypothetical protein [Acinetobacter indicus]|uniref:hypothetical protein n=1 Tax=Acinetobacter indicus TaxID=756892 RepID=UPI0012E1AA09|nr:hypothetical protein [Acinetobacter indicus]